jgi:hypothetical protein
VEGGPKETYRRFVDEARKVNGVLKLYEAATGGADVRTIRDTSRGSSRGAWSCRRMGGSCGRKGDMKKVHDMGGRHEDFGPIDRSGHQIVLNAKGHKTTDEMRRAIESLDEYKEMGYYERWAAAVRVTTELDGICVSA